jgi:K+-transporting ATPase ATPase C chain
LNPALTDRIAAQVKLFHDADPDNTRPVPVDLVTGSASGLDPEISPAAAEYQASRVARLRNLPLTRVQELIAQHQKSALFDVLGEARINVLELNLALDSLR